MQPSLYLPHYLLAAFLTSIFWKILALTPREEGLWGQYKPKPKPLSGGISLLTRSVFVGNCVCLSVRLSLSPPPHNTFITYVQPAFPLHSTRSPVTARTKQSLVCLFVFSCPRRLSEGESGPPIWPQFEPFAQHGPRPRHPPDRLDPALVFVRSGR